jgi:hypothetical protein
VSSGGLDDDVRRLDDGHGEHAGLEAEVPDGRWT